MGISQKEVEYIAHLARLQLSEEEYARLSSQLTTILEYFEKLKNLDTTNVPPLSHVVPLKNIYREDNTSIFRDIEEILNNAPEAVSAAAGGKFFKVKKVVE
jgi:aspartyl-tRNA(Asn)/glutamyl-tRNA(Gln) amidotransferase subunit C